MKQTFPTNQDLLDARSRIADLIHRTPILTSRLINEITGAQCYFKCENFQRMGAFKMRGASNAILSLSEAERARGVITHSSGNFAQALSLAAQNTKTKAYIVMPVNAPTVKKAAVRDYGGNIIESGNSPAEREAKAAEVRISTGATFIHPSNDLQVIIGNSTAGQELIEDIPDLDIIIAPVGGGGLSAGTALAAHHFSHAKVIGAEPSGADDAYRSLRDGVIYLSEHPNTICDGLRTNLGDINFPIIKELLQEILLVDDQDTIHAMRLLFERMKIVVEPSGAIVLGAVMTHKEQFAGKKVGLILSGGNVDVRKLGEWFK
ncbi:MAG TPA: threonine/serine dehydratase [Saprospiraceae bacterium]|nr:threonine/serine dehydratase [Saprospiraceae bacterium]